MSDKSVILSNVSLRHSENQAWILSGINLTISKKVTGVVGTNGSGKTTLLSLISGEITPSYGSIIAPQRIGYLKQSICFDKEKTVADIIGVSEVLKAISRIESGSISKADFDIVGNNWDIEERVKKIISKRIPSLNLEDIFERSTSELSGGEIVRLIFCGLQLSSPEIILLDEPTNNLDSAGKSTLISEIREFSGKVIVASHDIELLNHADEIIEVYKGGVNIYGGDYKFYQEQIEIEQESAIRKISDAAKEYKKEKSIYANVLRSNDKQSKRDKAKHAPIIRKGKLKSVHSDPTLKRSAEARRANKAKLASERVASKGENFEKIQKSAREFNSIKIPLINPDIASSKKLLCLKFSNYDFIVGGHDKISLTGPNGSGKTTIVKSAIANAPSTRVGFIDQKLELPDKTAFEVLKESAPEKKDHDIYEFLSKFLITGEIVHRKTSTLSGGERFRVALASTLFQSAVPEILVLDEPTNNLDNLTVKQLVDVLSSYSGALLVISHDKNFLNSINFDNNLCIENFSLLGVSAGKF